MEKQYEIAKLMHDEYEAYSLKVGWKTQKKCQTLFDELPPVNKEVMLWVAGSILEKIKKEMVDKLLIKCECKDGDCPNCLRLCEIIDELL